MTSKVKYLGDLRTEMIHFESNNVVLTDAPKDNHGKGEAFSPTDLVATALASCMISIMGIKQKDSDKSIIGTEATVKKVMYSEPRRIGEIHVHITVPDCGFTEKEKNILINAAHTCPVAKSLDPSIQQVITIEFQPV